MIVNILFILLMPFLFVGIVNKTKAIWTGRRGAPVWQPYVDFFRLMRKNEVTSRTTSFIFDISGALSLAAILAAAMLIPFGQYHALISFRGDFVLFLYLMGLAKFVAVLAALDTGSAFEGMGASREMSFTTFLEPAFFLVVASLIYISGAGTLSELISMHTVKLSSQWSLMISALTVIALFIMLLVEGSRVPFDDPTTHLELTMVHEVMVLDHSGPNFGFMLYANALKMTLFASLIAYFLIPWNMGIAAVTALYIGIMVVQATFLGMVESILPRVRMTRNPELVFVPLSVALLALTALIVLGIGGA